MAKKSHTKRTELFGEVSDILSMQYPVFSGVWAAESP